MTVTITISLIVLAIWYSMQEGEIFAKLGDQLAKLPHQLHQPLFDCPICMTPWYGSIVYVVWQGVNWYWPLTVIAAMGLNVVIVKLWSKSQNDLDINQPENVIVTGTKPPSSEKDILK